MRCGESCCLNLKNFCARTSDCGDDGWREDERRSLDGDYGYLGDYSSCNGNSKKYGVDESEARR